MIPRTQIYVLLILAASTLAGCGCIESGDDLFGPGETFLPNVTPACTGSVLVATSSPGPVSCTLGQKGESVGQPSATDAGLSGLLVSLPPGEWALVCNVLVDQKFETCPAIKVDLACGSMLDRWCF